MKPVHRVVCVRYCPDQHQFGRFCYVLYSISAEGDAIETLRRTVYGEVMLAPDEMHSPENLDMLVLSEIRKHGFWEEIKILSSEGGGATHRKIVAMIKIPQREDPSPQVFMQVIEDYLSQEKTFATVSCSV